MNMELEESAYTNWRTHMQEVQKLKLKYVVNSNASSERRNSLFWTSSGSTPPDPRARPLYEWFSFVSTACADARGRRFVVYIYFYVYRSWWAEERIWWYKPRKREDTNTFAVCILVTHIRIHGLHSYIYTNHILCAPAYIPTLHTNLHTNNPTNAPTPYIPTRPPHTYTTYLHTYTTPTNLQNPTYLPYPCIPTLHLQLLHPTLHTGPIITHKLQEQAARWCGCVLPVREYFVLRILLAKLSHLNLISWLRASCGRKGCWIPTKICNSGRLHNHYWSRNIHGSGFLVFGLLCRHTASNPITAEMLATQLHKWCAVIRNPGSAWPNRTTLPQWTSDTWMLVEVNIFVCWKCIEDMGFCFEFSNCMLMLKIGIVIICSLIFDFFIFFFPLFRVLSGCCLNVVCLGGGMSFEVLYVYVGSGCSIHD